VSIRHAVSSLDRRAAFGQQRQNTSTPQFIDACANLRQSFDESIVGWWRMMEKNFSILDQTVTVAPNMTHPHFDCCDLEGDWETAKKRWNSLSMTVQTFTCFLDRVH
jgi:hypothetical protein